MDSTYEVIAERLRWMQDCESGIPVGVVCRKHGISRMTLNKWLKRYRESGQDPESLVNQSRVPHRSPMQTPEEINQLVQQLRTETGGGPRKIREMLLEEHNIILSERTIAKIFLRTSVAHNTDCASLRERYANPQVPGHVIQVGVLAITLPDTASRIVQYTALDSVTRLRIVKFYRTHSTLNALDFIQQMRDSFPFPIVCLQTNIDTVFTSITHPGSKSHAFTANAEYMGMTHIVTAPEGRVRNGKLDRAHRIDINEFYDANTQWAPEALVNEMQAFIDYYNNQRKTSELGNKTPAEALRSFTIYTSVIKFKPV